jgi:hypothetical protein
MKRWLTVLVLLAGLGSFISCKHPAPHPQKPAHEPSKQADRPVQTESAAKLDDPFVRYLDDQKSNRLESALKRFAGECGVDIYSIKPLFAVSAGGDWLPTKNLTEGLNSLESDFYSVAEVWPEEDRVLVEIWANSDDVGSEVRVYRCFSKGKLLRAESIDWNLPMEQPNDSTWGYARRWEAGKNGSMERTQVQFVDGMERPIPKPKLDADDEKSLNWMPSLGPLNELKLPPALLR